jgi:hypothetical protein
MKKFKTLIKQITESESFGGTVFNGFSDPSPRSALSPQGTFYAFKNPEQLARLNSYISSYLSGSYLNPKEALKELGAKLAASVGVVLVFDNTKELKVGVNNILVRVFGEKFGVTPTTDLTKQPFDRGEDYPDLVLRFNLMQQPNGFIFAEPKLISQLCTDCPEEIGAEANQTGKETQPDTLYGTPESLPEETDLFEEKEKEKKKHKDPARVVELFLLKNEDANKRILRPIYDSLLSSNKKGKYESDSALKRFVYAVEAATRTLSNSGRTINVNDEQKLRAAKRLLFNFEKYMKSGE